MFSTIKEKLFLKINELVDLDAILKKNVHKDIQKFMGLLIIEDPYGVAREMLKYFENVSNESVTNYMVENNIEKIYNTSHSFSYTVYNRNYVDICKKISKKISKKLKNNKEITFEYIGGVCKSLYDRLHPILSTEDLINDITDDSLLERVYKTAEDDYLDNYESLETIGDAILQSRLFNLLGKINLNFTPPMFHAYKKNTQSKEYLASIYNAFGLGQIFELSETAIDTKEDIVEALFGYLYYELSKRLGNDMVDLILDKLVLKTVTWKTFDNMSLITEPVKNLVEKKILNDTKVSIKGNLAMKQIKVYVQVKELNKFLGFLKRKPESGEVFDIGKKKLQLYKVYETDPGNIDQIKLQAKAGEKTLTDEGYRVLIDKMMGKFKFNIVDVYKYYTTRFISEDIINSLNNINGTNILRVEPYNLEKKTVLTFQNFLPLGPTNPENVVTINIADAMNRIESFNIKANIPHKIFLEEAKKLVERSDLEDYIKRTRVCIASYIIENLKDISSVILEGDTGESVFENMDVAADTDGDTDSDSNDIDFNIK